MATARPNCPIVDGAVQPASGVWLPRTAQSGQRGQTNVGGVEVARVPLGVEHVDDVQVVAVAAAVGAGKYGMEGQFRGGLGVLREYENLGEARFNIRSNKHFIAPRGVPKEIIAKINAATDKLLDDPAINKRLTSLGLEVPPKNERSPEYLTQLAKDEMAKWGPPIKAAISAK